MGFKELCPAKIVSVHQMSWIFPNNKNKTLQIMYANILTFLQWEKAPTGIGQPSTGH
jgi:hypothetical protein